MSRPWDHFCGSSTETSRWLAVTTGQTGPADGEERELLEAARELPRTFVAGAGRLSGAGDREAFSVEVGGVSVQGRIGASSNA